MLKAYKYRIYPNSEQRIQIAKTFGCCRFVYNQTLAYRKEIYEKEKKAVMARLIALDRQDLIDTYYGGKKGGVDLGC